MSSFVAEINSLEKELKRIGTLSKQLKLQKKTAEGNLYNYMCSLGIETYENYSLAKLKPKEKKKRMSRKEKRNNFIQLMTEIGAPDPYSLWNELNK